MRTIAIITVLLALAGCSKSTPEVTELNAGDPLPDFRIMTDAQDIISSEDFDEGYGLIVFFNTSCPDCREELPVIQNLYESHGDSVIFLAISRAEKENSVRQYWKNNNLTIPYSAQDDDTLFKLFAPHTIPRTYLIKEGHIASSWKDDPVMQEEDFKVVL